MWGWIRVSGTSHRKAVLPLLHRPAEHHHLGSQLPAAENAAGKLPCRDHRDGCDAQPLGHEWFGHQCVGLSFPLQLSLTHSWHRVTTVQGGTSSQDHGNLSASPMALLPCHVLWERLMATNFRGGVAPWQPTHCTGGLRGQREDSSLRVGSLLQPEKLLGVCKDRHQGRFTVAGLLRWTRAVKACL